MQQWSRYRALVGAILIGSSLGAAERPEPGKESSTPGGEIWVELVETTGLEAGVLARMQSEVDAIYATAGVRVRWLRESPAEIEPYGARVYIMEALPPSLDTRLRVFGDSSPMGLAFGAAETTSGPIIYVSRAAVALKASGGAVAEPRGDALAKALGRVVAHELAHRFVSSNHTRRGILKADFGGSDLIAGAGSLFFTEGQIEKLQRLARVDAEDLEAGKAVGSR